MFNPEMIFIPKMPMVNTLAGHPRGHCRRHGPKRRIAARHAKAETPLPC